MKPQSFSVSFLEFGIFEPLTLPLLAHIAHSMLTNFALFVSGYCRIQHEANCTKMSLHAANNFFKNKFLVLGNLCESDCSSDPDCKDFHCNRALGYKCK